MEIRYFSYVTDRQIDSNISRRITKNEIENSKRSNLHSVVLSTRYNPPSIRSKPNGINTSSMTLVSVNAPLFSHIPYFQICVQRTRCKELTKGMEVQRYAIGSVTREGTNYYSGHETSHIHIAILYFYEINTRILVEMHKQRIYYQILLLASSKSQSLMVPLAAPAATKTSEESKLTESIPLE